MEKMQEAEFDRIKQKITPNKCQNHYVVKLYYLGTHSDYGCRNCKMKSSILKDFESK